MKKILIGISSPTNAVARNAASTITEHYNIEHINMRQPVLDMLAALTGIHSTELEHDTPQTMLIENLGTTIADAEASLAFNLRAMNKTFFIKRAESAIKQSACTMHAQIFNGHLVSGIKTEMEAEWLRSAGGLLIHLCHYDNKTPIHFLNKHPDDLSIPLGINTTGADIKAILPNLTNQKQAA
ncbi:hypothetical protein D0C16_05610 [Cellvibrio sp. KY-GH-1]|uniref:hypothetical protein n=1 Tax=Cellvibrio sp. KY-GH-1 TaxID=2303332 RepID=UPI0012485012|nr:hypothetical protein [Cellvibrio sp. KY-GH-1]QEY15497.1 hypothetical protein D0C16_05610 [Cellvibrio sp. KY-GH-1]